MQSSDILQADHAFLMDECVWSLFKRSKMDRTSGMGPDFDENGEWQNFTFLFGDDDS